MANNETTTTLWRGWMQGVVTAYSFDRWQTWVVESVTIDTTPRNSAPLTPQEQSDDYNRFVEAQAKRDAAIKKAEALLDQYLTPEQRAALKENGTFQVRGSAGGEYKIGRGSRVGRVVAGRVAEYLCCHPDSVYPVADTMLTQKLWIECAEDDFRKIANITVVAEPARVQQAA